MKSPCKTYSDDEFDSSSNTCAIKHVKSPVTPLNNGRTPERRRHYLRNVASDSPLHAVRSIQKIHNINLASTPTRNELVPVHNPFEVEVDSFLATSYSPSIFSISKKTPSEKSPFWSIEHMSIIHPADIDESSQQDSYFNVDAEKEVKVQEAIDAFFSTNSIAPSPWTPAIKCSSFAPYLASTACPLQIESDLMSSEACISSQDDENAKDVCTQTVLTIPPFLDLMTLLAHFYTYQPNAHKDSLDSSFGRRKLFVDDDDDVCDDKEDHSLCLPINQESNNNNINTNSNNEEGHEMETPKTGCLPFCIVTPLSDHCSSSPISRRKFSLYKNSPGLISPDISPLVAKSYRRISRTNSNIPENNQPNDVADSSLMMVSMCEHEVTTLSNEQTSSNKDTGYFTNTTGGVTSDSQQFRATPVTELLEDCAITKKPFTVDTMEMSQDGYSDTSNMSFKFNVLPCQTDTFTTPTKK